jgi:hypothetical protein
VVSQVATSEPAKTVEPVVEKIGANGRYLRHGRFDGTTKLRDPEPSAKPRARLTRKEVADMRKAADEAAVARDPSLADRLGMQRTRKFPMTPSSGMGR